MKRRKVLAVILSLCLLITTTAGMTTTVAGDGEHVHNLRHYDEEASTCITYGHIEYWYCADCNSRYTDAAATNLVYTRDLMLPLDPNNHRSEPTLTNSVAATCTTDGYNKYYYSCCGTTYTETVYATGHSWDNGTVTTEATCTEDGVITYTCEVCGLTKTETIAAKGHSWGAIEYFWSSDRQTCTATRTCQNDSSHVEVAYATITSEVKTAATCTASGEITYTGSFSVNWATQQQTQVIISATGHSWGDTVYTWSQDGKSCTAKRTCTNDGTHVETATATISDVVSKSATCTEKGETTYTAVFSESWASEQTKVVEDIPANGHSLVHVLAVDATCTTEGNIEYWHCLDCGYYFSDADCTNETTQAGTILSALGHTLQHFEAVEAGCDTVGNVEYWYCGDCDTYFSDADATAEITLSQTVVAATGEHEYEVSAIVWNYEDGTATVKCLECGEYHTFDATVTSKNVLGQKTYTITTTINGTEYTVSKTTGTSLMMVQASYSAVTAAIEKANSLNPSDYEDFTLVTDAINAVDWSLSVLNQKAVNAYAEAIEAAINNLVLAETVDITEESIEIVDPVEAGETDAE